MSIREDAGKAKTLVMNVKGSMQQDGQDSVIDRDVIDEIQKDPRIGFALLHLLLEDYAPKGGDRKMSEDYRATLLLLEEALTGMRYSIERDRQWAIDSAERIQKMIAEKAFHVEVDSRVQADLVQAIYDAGLELHPEIKEKSEEVSEYYGRFSRRSGPPDLERVFDVIAAESPDDPFPLYDRMMADLNLLPVQGQLVLIAEMTKSRKSIIREVSALMLLHPDSEVRTLVPMIFGSMVGQGTIDPVSLRRMIGLRNWLPPSERSAVDEVIRKIRKARVECAPLPKVQSVEAFAGPFDGGGNHAGWVIGKEKRRYRSACLLVRQGQGVRTCWGERDLSKGDVSSLVRDIRRDGRVEPVQSAYLARMLSHFIWVGQQQGNPPPPELMQAAEAMGHECWLPQPVVIEGEIAALEETETIRSLTAEDIDLVLEKSGAWPSRSKFAESWFEDDARVDDLMKEKARLPIRSDGEMARVCGLILDEILEKKRDVWSERLLWMALWARSLKTPQTPWQDFFVLARMLRQGTPFVQIPLMIAVAERTFYSALRRMKEMP